MTTTNDEGKTWEPMDVFQEIANAPRPELSAESRLFLRTDPEGWSASRKRQIRTAVLTADRELFKNVVNEYVAVRGIDNGILIVLTIWGNIVEELTSETRS